MALLVADTRREEFSKPPPKKKWLQEYIEKDSQSDSITSNLSTEAREFVRLFDNQTDENLNSNLKQLSESKNSANSLTLSQDVIGGVVQGVLNQFQTFFENECSSSSAATFQNKALPPAPSELKVKKLSKLLDPTRNGAKFNESLKRISWPGSPEKPAQADIPEAKEDLKISQNDITPVVQSVISQFLNGNLADSDFRRSRKRSHKHANCHHRDKSGSCGPAERTRRSSSVIQFKSKTPENESMLKIKKPDEQASEGSVIVPSIIKEKEHFEEVDENQALNLSLPKAHHRVTFATQDRCYSTESVKSFQPSKSEELSNLDILAQASDDRTKLSISRESNSIVPSDLTTRAESMRIAAKNVSSITANPQENEPGFYEMSKSYIELTPVIRRTMKEESPVNMGLPSKVQENTFKPIVMRDSYNSQSPPLLEVARRPQFASLPSSRQTSPVCLKKTAYSPPLSTMSFPPPHPELIPNSPTNLSIPKATPNTYVTSSPVKISNPITQHYKPTSPRLSPTSPSQHQHLSISPPPLTVLKKAEPAMYSFPVIKPKPIKPFLETINTQSKPIYPSPFHPKPQGNYESPLDPQSNNKTSDPAPSTSTPSRPIREKADINAKDDIKKTSSTTREVHNRLEKNRRAHLKMCFDELAAECDLDPKKASNLTVIRSAYKYIMSLRRKERENEKNLAALVQEKIRRQNRLEELKREFPGYNPESDGE